MAFTRHGIARVVFGFLPTLVTFAVLAGVFVWGMATHWKLVPPGERAEGASAAEASEPPVKVTPVAVPEGTQPPVPSVRARLEFPSKDEVEKAGFRFAKARTKTLTGYVAAEGSVGYDPHTYAVLSARAVGTLFWAEKQVGQPVAHGETLALVEAAEVGRIKSDFLASLTRFELQSRNLENLEKLRAEGAGSERTLRETEAAVTEARLKLVSDQQALLNLGLKVTTEEIRKLTPEQRVERLQFVGVPPELLPRVSERTRSANLLPVVCPVEGAVVKRNVAIGEAVTPGKPLFAVAGLKRLHLELAVDPRDMPQVRLGLTALFSPESDPDYEASGEIVHITPDVDEVTRKVWVHAEADNPDGRLRPNSFGRGRIRLGEHPASVVVPQEALQRDNAEQLVFVRVGPKAFEARRVKPGLHEGGLVAVEGVHPGEEVVTTGSHDLLTELLRDRLEGASE